MHRDGIGGSRQVPTQVGECVACIYDNRHQARPWFFAARMYAAETRERRFRSLRSSAIVSPIGLLKRHDSHGRYAVARNDDIFTGLRLNYEARQTCPGVFDVDDPRQGTSLRNRLSNTQMGNGHRPLGLGRGTPHTAARMLQPRYSERCPPVAMAGNCRLEAAELEIGPPPGPEVSPPNSALLAVGRHHVQCRQWPSLLNGAVLPGLSAGP